MTRPAFLTLSDRSARQGRARPPARRRAKLAGAAALLAVAVALAGCRQDISSVTHSDPRYGYSFAYDATRLFNGGPTGMVDKTALNQFILYDHSSATDRVAAVGMSVFAGNGIDPTVPQLRQIASQWNAIRARKHPGVPGAYRITRFFPQEPGLLLLSQTKLGGGGGELMTADYTWFEARYWYQMHLQALKADWPAFYLYYQQILRSLTFNGMGIPGPAASPPTSATP